MKNKGKIFEDNFKKSIDESQIYYLRIKDSPSSFGSDSQFVRFTNNNPYDNLCFYKRYLFPFELKTTKNNSISIQRSKEEKGKSIKLNQIEGLSYARRYDCSYAGFIFDFTDEEDKNNDITYWLDILDFNRFLTNCNKKSINKKDVADYGGIEIKKQLKRVHYKYDIIELLNDIVKISNGKNEVISG